MKIDVLPIGMYEENSYIVHDCGHVLLVDPGRYANEIIKRIGPKETVDGIVLTHGHSDHTGAVDDLVDYYHCPVFLSAADRILIDPEQARCAGAELPVYSGTFDLPEGIFKAGSFDLEIIATPGHTQGSVLIRYRNVLFTGDTLFAGDIGRTDLFGGDEEMMLASLRRIAKLPNDWIIYPGHGPASTIGTEKKTNYYLSRLG